MRSSSVVMGAQPTLTGMTDPSFAARPGGGAVPRRRVAAAAAAALLLAGALLVEYAVTTSAEPPVPVPGLAQLDLLFLDQPAPLLDRLGHVPGEPLLLVVCEGCAAPAVAAPTVVTADARVAEAYALRTAEGRVGPGYALVDGEGRVRYSTFDTGVSRHAEEIAVLLSALP